ncbi:hypothetical protein ALC56_04942 [Trachymyrmex septentrionalis]|uniref:Uncharacterized protein n=1 Tax=Trachymyrmex septentrionalis TaxID=34720 RepID=A0A195FJQ6_9HYME|nr:hypothetical protein ALC56_04942 [Trachymyrmex septentrionalis]
MAPAGRTCRIRDSDSNGDNDDGDIPLIVSTDNYSVSRLNVSVIFFDNNPVPCGKKRVNDYGAAPEAAQWNGSMDEPPVASLANQPLTQGMFDNLCIQPCTPVKGNGFVSSDVTRNVTRRYRVIPQHRQVS